MFTIAPIQKLRIIAYHYILNMRNFQKEKRIEYNLIRLVQRNSYLQNETLNSVLSQCTCTRCVGLLFENYSFDHQFDAVYSAAFANQGLIESDWNFEKYLTRFRGYESAAHGFPRKFCTFNFAPFLVLHLFQFCNLIVRPGTAYESFGRISKTNNKRFLEIEK